MPFGYMYIHCMYKRQLQHAHFYIYSLPAAIVTSVWGWRVGGKACSVGVAPQAVYIYVCVVCHS